MASKKQSNIFLGIFLILAGIFFLLIQLGKIHWVNFWPIILIFLGLLFLVTFVIDRRNYGLLMPGTILTLVGLLFLYMTFKDWYCMEALWPTFVLAPGIGFWLMHLLGPKSNQLWIPGTILILVSIVFYAQIWYYFNLWPLLLIIAGIYLLLTYKREKTSRTENASSHDKDKAKE